MRRTLLTLLSALPLVGLLGALSLHGPVVEAAGARALTKIEKRLGLPVSAQRIDASSDSGRLERLRVGPADAPLLTARTIHADIAADTRWSLSPWPERVRVSGVVVHVHGDGTLEGALRALRDAAPTRAGTGGPRAGGARALPKIELDDGRLIDHSGGLEVHDITVRFLDGKFTGKARVTTPELGPCSFDGDFNRVRVRCRETMSVSLPGGLLLVGQGIELERKPTPRVTLPGVTVESTRDDGGFADMLGGLSADLSVNLEKDAQGRRPVRARLALPGGGQIVGHGRGDPQHVQVRADVSGLSLDPVHRALSGSLSGNLTVSLDVPTRTAVIEGEAELSGLRVQHRALADGPVGPFPLSLAGRITVHAPTKDPKAIKVTLEKGRVEVGDVKITLEGAFDNTGEHAKVKAEIHVPQVNAMRVSQAIPPGLLPHLQPFRVAGQFAFDAKLDLDMAELKKTVLDASVDLEKLKVLEISDRIGFGRLRKTFYTRFEMPNGEIIVRETGPRSGRWTPMSEIPPLLPKAVTAQEDGGFYRHKGVSMLHLRGSLVRNLERGRFARGGSTLTMQLARNLFLNRRKTLSRKLEEVVLTWLLERSFTKRELMTLYLNVVEFGDHVFGIGEAARHYFHKAPRDLSPTEIAFLVRLLPAPRIFGKQFTRGRVDPRYARRMKRLLKRLVSRGALSNELYLAAQPEMLWQAPQDPIAAPDLEDVPPGVDPEFAPAFEEW